MREKELIHYIEEKRKVFSKAIESVMNFRKEVRFYDKMGEIDHD